jgi:membrane peptidoglycan carboxypeptidase
MTRRTPLRQHRGAVPRRAPRPRNPGSFAALPAIILGVFAALAAGVFLGLMAIYGSYTSGLPNVAGVEDVQLSEGSRVVSADGVELATFAAEQRQSITFEQIPQIMVDAQIAAEDQTFWTNPCVDLRSILRAFYQNFASGQEVSGASTICQQLVRMRLLSPALLTDPGRQVERKLKEALLALRLGQRYSGEAGKQKILEMYMNQIYYGDNAYGIWAAANAYLGKDITKSDTANSLTVGEAALLAGLVRSPSALDPTKVAVEQTDADGNKVLVVPADSDAIRVQGYVLGTMRSAGFITQAQYEAAMQQPIVLAPTKTQQFKAPHFVYAVRAAAGDLLGGEQLIDSGGLTITTTLDYNGYQVFAEKWAAIAYDMNHMTTAQLTTKYGKAAMSWINKLNQKRNINNDALVTVNYRTGAVLAYVGSANYYGEKSDTFDPFYDVVGTAYRQAGSAFKPIMYSTGFELNKITPATMFMDVRGTIVGNYSVPDADGLERGPVRIRDALKYSLNIPAVKAQQVIGTQNVVDQAVKMGIRWDPRQAQEVAIPSLTLGTIGVHMIDLAGAYGAIANGGELATPYLIDKITDRNGTVIYDHATDGPQPARVLSPQAAYLTTDILADNTDPRANPWWGPSFQLPGLKGGRRPATLKTGTTNDFKDLQAFGYLAPAEDPADSTGAIVTGVWVGNSDNSAIKGVFAADGPTFIWHDYMAEVAKKNQLPVNDFIRPNGIVEVKIDAISGMLPGPNTTKTVTEVFKSDDVPTQQDTTHVQLSIEAATGKIWQPGCGDQLGATPAPDTSPSPGASPSATASPSAPAGTVYLDLSTWNASHPTWVSANLKWIDKWRGKESKVPRFPTPSLDAPLAPTELCTPGEVPTSTPTPSPTPSPSPSPEGTVTPGPSVSPTPKPTPQGSPTPAPAPTP